ncbi:aromatic-amino-acid aminotransferase [Aureobasidium sp. EXF-3400]|nr:aromatic-amino-acid aminotransferase [Aureobasidium sp. EXF-12344]KAI4779337.1 aromatic-amino-acid aminotransferase [Aureobasidium sp. EXF-3400]
MSPSRDQVDYSVCASWFAEAKFNPPDAIFALTAHYDEDPSTLKVNLGQGTYRDDAGKPWVLPVVQRARKMLFDGDLNHEYLPILGLKAFRQRAAQVVLGPCYAKFWERVTHPIFWRHNTLAICQSLSGTGGLHLTGLLLKTCRGPSTKVYIPDPTWSNHQQVFETLGFQCITFPYYDYRKKALDIDSYLSTLQEAEPGSIVILHACAHNPTGCDPTKEQWRNLGKIMKERHLFPLFDAAYLGFNSGSIDSDAFAIRTFVDELELEVAVCVSFAKNMGLYGERVGCVVIVSDSPAVAVKTQSTLEMIQRSEVSNPPAFGAKIASAILGSEDLRRAWYDDLNTMSGRIRKMRTQLFDELVNCGTSRLFPLR